MAEACSSSSAMDLDFFLAMIAFRSSWSSLSFFFFARMDRSFCVERKTHGSYFNVRALEAELKPGRMPR